VLSSRSGMEMKVSPYREVGHHEIDFLFISRKLQRVGMEIESALK